MASTNFKTENNTFRNPVFNVTAVGVMMNGKICEQYILEAIDPKNPAPHYIAALGVAVE